MYPYNRKTQLYHTPIGAKEKTDKQNPDLSTDRRLRELLELAKQDAAAMEQKYTALLQEERLQNAKDILKTMETDCKKHQRILREILCLIFNETFEGMSENLPKAEEKDSEKLLEELLFTEMDDITFYRNLLSSMQDDDLWYLIFEIITDKENHTAALNHLYAKYFAKTTGQENAFVLS